MGPGLTAQRSAGGMRKLTAASLAAESAAQPAKRANVGDSCMASCIETECGRRFMTG
jgi:hypothetical protein